MPIKIQELVVQVKVCEREHSHCAVGSPAPYTLDLESVYCKDNLSGHFLDLLEERTER